ncbi:hypothetical protein C1I92_27820 [Jiangella anatolica]|uniref:Uncharacterized protein n=1 Tax=Jiangella anatolica TaxID=2670374 RepID=A0A2W2CIP8_9ACTN|nr:hypothetical protein C1I92_27820 [Jiangella anatolica]
MVIPSVMELAVYGTLATAVAVAVMVANDRALWQAAALVVAAAILIGLVAFVARRAQPEDLAGEPGEPAEPGPQRSGARRRRRH